jgi:hypothetical protein
MGEWLLQLVGIDATLSQRLGEAQWTWARPWLFWFGAVALLPLGWFVLRRHRRSLPHLTPGQRGVLTTCRVGVLGVLVFVLGGPYLRLEESIEHKPIVAILVDGSQSMALPVGGYRDDARLGAVAAAAGLHDADATLSPEVRRELTNLTRAELVARVWDNHAGAMLPPLQERFDVRGSRFAGRVEPTAASELAAESGEGLGSGTAIGEALRRVADDAGARPIAGVLLLSDGQSNRGADPIEVVRDLRATAGDTGAMRVWTVPVGGDERLTDISLLDVLAPPRLTRGDTAMVVATIASHGFADREVNVRLREGGEVLHEQAVVLADDRRQQVTLNFEADTPGLRLLTVEVERLAEEQVADNNQRVVAIEVDESQWQVLYLEGYPRWDYRFLDHALRRDRGLSVRIVMEDQLAAQLPEGESLASAARLPQDAEAWAEHDVVVLGDVSEALLTRRHQEELARAVRDRGLGLIVQAGPLHMPHTLRGGPLAALLPVEPVAGDEASGDRGGWEAPAFAPYRMAVTATGASHPALRLYDQAARNRGVWSQMPAFYWAAAVGEPRPGATVLATLEAAERRAPLVAEHFAGRGRVLFIGTDATYRWRRNIGDHLFYRFWGQAVRHVASTAAHDDDTSWLAVDPPRVEPGESIGLELFSVDASGRAREAVTATVSITRGEWSESVDLQRTPTPGLYRGRWTPPDPGEYAFTHADAANRRATASALVAPSEAELLRPDVDRDALGRLADTGGGELIEIDELSRFAAALEGEAVEQRRVVEQEVWDNWLTLLVLIGLYCTDVYVRRMTGVM